jgi:hypothetical protein
MPALSYSPQSQPCHLVQTNDCLSGSNQYPILTLLLINSGGGFKTYITQQPDQSWRGKIESESVKGKVAVFPNEEGIPDVRLLN